MLAIDIGTAFIKIIDPVSGRRGILESPYTLQSSLQKPDEKFIAGYLRHLLAAIDDGGDKSNRTNWADRPAIAALPAFASVFAPEEYAEIYRRIFEKAGLNLVKFMPEGQALAGLPAKNGTTLIIDLGDRSTGFFLMENGRLVRMSQTDFAVQSFFSNGADVSDIWNAIIKEVHLTLGSRGADQFMLVGGGANVAGVKNYFGAELNLSPLEFGGDPQFAVAEGLILNQ